MLDKEQLKLILNLPYSTPVNSASQIELAISRKYRPGEELSGISSIYARNRGEHVGGLLSQSWHFCHLQSISPFSLHTTRAPREPGRGRRGAACSADRLPPTCDRLNRGLSDARRYLSLGQRAGGQDEET